MEKSIITPSGRFWIRPFEPGDEAKVLKLWEKAFGREMPLKLWRWKYTQNPWGQRIMLCMSEEGQVVVMFAALPYKGLAGGRNLEMLHAVDNMSHPAFRGTISGRQGLFAITAKHFFRMFANEQGAGFVYGFPGQRHFRLGRMILNYASLPKGMTYLEADVQKMKTGLRLFSGKCKPETAAGKEFDGLAPSLRERYPFMILRDASFLNWRFTRHPLYEYEIWSYRSLFTSRLKGYSVIKVQGT